MNNITGKRIDIALKNANISQKLLAEHIGVSPSAISQYINGKTSPSDDTLIKICKVLKISPGYLKGFDNADIPATDNVKIKYEILIDYYENMNDEGKDRLISYADDIFVKYKKEETNV